MKTNLQNHTILMTEGDVGTIAIMEYLRNKEYPYCQHTIFTNNPQNRFALVVSSCNPCESLLREIDLGITKWFEYNGMKRNGNPLDGWYFLIDGHWYFCSKY